MFVRFAHEQSHQLVFVRSLRSRTVTLFMYVCSVSRSAVTSVFVADATRASEMRDLAAVLEEAVQLNGIPKSEIPELILDDKCRTTELSVLVLINSCISPFTS